MLTAVIPLAKRLKETATRIASAIPSAQCIELRLDYPHGETPDYRGISALRKQFDIPMIFTLRKKSQGGLWRSDEDERLEALFQLAKLQPEYIDIEYDVPREFIYTLHSMHPNTRLICSWHDFHHTPFDLANLLARLQQSCFYSYKIAAYAQTRDDALRMLAFVAKHHSACSLTGICMGALGRLTRILSQTAGNAFHYAALSEGCTVSPGQVTISELLTFLKN